MNPDNDLKKAVVDCSTELYRGNSFSFVNESITLPNGTKTRSAFVRHPGSTAIVPLTEDDTVIMTRQYRHPVDDYLFEIPAGTMKPAETPLDCARRELEEETGIIAETLTPVSCIHILPSYSDEIIHIFLARQLCDSQQKLDPDEIIAVVKFPLEKVRQMIQEGVVTCALTILAIQQVSLYLENETRAAGHVHRSDRY